jgi:hypothetical protein
MHWDWILRESQYDDNESPPERLDRSLGAISILYSCGRQKNKLSEEKFCGAQFMILRGRDKLTAEYADVSRLANDVAIHRF